MTGNFLGERLRLARLMRGCTLQDAGEAVMVSRQHIHQLENDTRKPSEDVLAALAEYFDVEPGFFSMPIYNEVKLEQCHFRKRKTTHVGVSNRVAAYSTLFEQLVALLHEELELPEPNFDIAEQLGFDTSNLSPTKIEELAEAVREYWGLRIDCPIESMVAILESRGAVVTCFEGISDKVDALSVQRRYPLVIRNTAKESACRMRFDLAHECGHLIMHEGIETGDTKTEGEANAFASAFLLPRGAFTAEFQPCVFRGRLHWSELYELKRRWKVSVRAIIYRAHYLGLISAQQYRSANVTLNKSGQARKEDLDDEIPIEQPEVLRMAFQLLKNELQISFSDVARKLGISTSTLSQLTGIAPPATEEDDRKVVPIRW